VIVEIADATDPRLADYVALTDVTLRRRFEPEHGLFIAESAKVIVRAIAAGYRPRSLLLEGKWLDDLAGPIEEAGRLGADVFVAPPDVIESVTGYQVHRGALASMQRRELPPIESVLAGARRVVVLEDVVDHTNVGAVFRSAAALGVDAVLVTPRCADPLYRRSIRVSMGTVFAVPWTRIEPWPGGTDRLRAQGFLVAGLALSADAVDLDTFAQRHRGDKIAMVLGAEGDGLRRRTVEHCDVSVRIPMSGGVDSLNVAAAGAVAFWELRSR
jgi:tRNA G18 (ribose-2'-O)-methylase SpoU